MYVPRIGLPARRPAGSMDHLYSGSGHPWVAPAAPPTDAAISLEVARRRLPFLDDLPAQQGLVMPAVPVFGLPDGDAVIIRNSTMGLGLLGPESFNGVDSIAWCPPNSTPRSAEALITHPAAICFLLTDVLGVAHASWEQRKDPIRGDVTEYTLRLEDAGGTAMPPNNVERESLIDRLTKPS